MRLFKPIAFLVLSALLFPLSSQAQLRSFQKLYQTEHFTTCFDIAPTPDQGYIITGFEDRPAPFNMPLVPYLAKIDCRGEMEWVKKYGMTTNIDNTDPRVAALNDGDYVMMSTVLQANYDLLVTRVRPDGATVWQNTYGGPGKDVGRGMLRLSDDNIVVVGSTQSYGTDAGSVYSDMYAVKINSESGDTLWTKTYGNAQGIDDLWGLVENEGGDLTFVGRSFFDGGIWLSLIRTDPQGRIKWSKVIGKANHHSQGFDIQAFPNGDFIVTGFTTIAKVDFNSLVDLPVVRLDSDGNILWATVLHGSGPDLSEVGSTIVLGEDVVAVALESSSYPSNSPDLTKRLIYQLSPGDGTLLKATAFNGSGGQFPMIRKDWDGYIMSGFSDEFPGSWNDPVIIKLDEDFQSGCEETDLTSQTIAAAPQWDVSDIAYTTSRGGQVTAYMVDSLGTLFEDSTFCFSGTPLVNCETISNSENLTISERMVVYPNPTTGVVTLEFSTSSPERAVVELYNLQGVLLGRQEQEQSSSLQVDLSAYPAGTYFLKTLTTSGTLTQRVQKL